MTRVSNGKWVWYDSHNVCIIVPWEILYFLGPKETVWCFLCSYLVHTHNFNFLIFSIFDMSWIGSPIEIHYYIFIHIQAVMYIRHKILIFVITLLLVFLLALSFISSQQYFFSLSSFTFSSFSPISLLLYTPQEAVVYCRHLVSLSVRTYVRTSISCERNSS